MRFPVAFAEALGAGVGLILLLGALTMLRRPRLKPVFARADRSAKVVNGADRAALRRLSLPPDYLDICRAAGL